MRRARPSVAVALALGAITLVTGCAHAPWNPHGGWSVVRTKHITMYTDTKFAHSNTLESLEIAYAALFATLFRNKRIAPVEVVFMEAPAFLSILGRYRNGISAARLPGRGHLGRRGVVVMLDGTATTTAAHKLAHLFLHAAAPNAPLWLHEGYASYVETLQYRDDGGKNAVACLGHLDFNEPTIPLTDLFSWTWAQYDQSQKTDWYRFTARSLFDYFLLGEEGALRPGLLKLMNASSRGRPAQEVLAEIFPGMTIANLQQRMIEHRRRSEVKPRGLCPIPFPIAPENAADYARPRVEPLLKEDVEALMLRLLMLPRRGGYVDWYPPEVLSLAGAEAPAPAPRAAGQSGAEADGGAAPADGGAP